MSRARLARFVRIAGAATGLMVVYASLLRFPHPLFRHTLEANGLSLHSDRPISESAARSVLQAVAAKLGASPLYSAAKGRGIYICHSRWRQLLFFNKDYGVGGVAPYPITANVFLREARIEDNRLISPRGNAVAGARTLDYFITHEITHQLTGEAVGPGRYFRLPQWVREGYADYVAKGGAFDYAEAKKAFLADTAEMDWKRSGLYWRFHLLVAHMLDRRRMELEQLLANPPDQQDVESAVRKEPDP